MKKEIVLMTLVLLICSIGHAQLAKRDSLTRKEFNARARSLADAEMKDSLRWEADHLVASNKEDYILYAKEIYSFLKDSVANEKAHQKMLKTFPESEYAAKSSFNDLKGNYRSLLSLTKSFDAWNKRYKTFMEDAKFSKGINIQFIHELLDSGAVELAGEYAGRFKRAEKASFQYYLANYHYRNGDDSKSEELVKDLRMTYSDELTVDEDLKLQVELLLIQLYVKQKRWQECLPIYAQNEELINWLPDQKFDALMALERHFEAFLFLDELFAKYILTTDIEKSVPLLFEKLGSTTEAWLAYRARIDARRFSAKQDEWKASMMDKDSFDFELLDMQGKTVKSSDYKGKIIVLDFWATWCGPCIKSFPGMQAAVNHYKKDSDVVFLFINTWENGDDYKTNVENFIKKEGYDFHVVFDDTDRKKALVHKYGIDGIPTKIIIDKKGRVRFNSSGGSPVVKEVLDEITYKIGLIKEEEKGK